MWKHIFLRVVISRMYFTFSLISSFIGVLFALYLKLFLITGSFITNPRIFNIVLTGHFIIWNVYVSAIIFIGRFGYMSVPSIFNKKSSGKVFSKTILLSFCLLIIIFFTLFHIFII